MGVFPKVCHCFFAAQFLKAVRPLRLAAFVMPLFIFEKFAIFHSTHRFPSKIDRYNIQYTFFIGILFIQILNFKFNEKESAITNCA